MADGDAGVIAPLPEFVLVGKVPVNSDEDLNLGAAIHANASAGR